MEVVIGIDWSENKHDVAIMNEAGKLMIGLLLNSTFLFARSPKPTSRHCHFRASLSIHW